MSDDVSAEQNPLVFATATPGNHRPADNLEVRANLSRASRLDPIGDSIPANLAYFQSLTPNISGEARLAGIESQLIEIILTAQNL